LPVELEVDGNRKEGEVGAAADEGNFKARREADAAVANMLTFRRFKAGRACHSIHRPVLVRMGLGKL